MVNTNKKNQVSDISGVIENNPNILLIKIGKTTHQSLETLRKELLKSDSRIKVIKNTLFEKAINKVALKNNVYKDLKKQFLPLKETTGLVTFGENWNEGLKAVYTFSKKDSSLGLRMSLLDKTLYDSAKTMQIAQLPTKVELLAKVIGSMKSPMSKFVYALKYNTNKLVYILKQKSGN